MRSPRAAGRAVARALLCSLLFPAAASAQVATGFSAAEWERQGMAEAALQAALTPDSLARWARSLAARPHLAGTPGQVATRDSVVHWLRAAGLEVGYDSLVLYLPQPLHVTLERVGPGEPLELDLTEPPIEGDPATGGEPVPVFHAFSGRGAAQGEVVFAHYGLAADYAVLDSLGVSVRGRVVVARYGRAYRGIKVREAEARGASALVLYPDPEGDGFAKGAVYPEGPMRPRQGVQRGSVLNAAGDPSTPAGPSLPGATRVPEEEMRGPAGIPVIPAGYGAVARLLEELGGPVAPPAWQGKLPLTYHVGPGPAIARVEVRTERGEAAYHPAFNTIAAMRGTTWPDEWVILGAHRDAWGPGAIDNVSGTATVVAVARAFAAAADAGVRPRRTVVFATWDAEEWGVMGSIEWVEANAEPLRAAAVAYLNQDAVVSGSRFGAAASPELKTIVRDVTRSVSDPRSGGSVFEAWSAAAAASRAGSDPPAIPPVGDLGGGSDHKGFYLHLGVPAAGFGFGGPGGVYHSAYDTPAWMERFGDPGYEYHAATARLAAVMAARLANADVIPLDHLAMAELVEERLELLAAEVGERLEAMGAGGSRTGDLLVEAGADDPAADALREALSSARESARRLRAEGSGFARERDAWLAAGDGIESAAIAEVNRWLREVSFALTSRDGLPGEEWSRQLLFAADPDNGYASLFLPGPRIALRSGDLLGAAAQLGTLAAGLDRATAALTEARHALAGARQGGATSPGEASPGPSPPRTG